MVKEDPVVKRLKMDIANKRRAINSAKTSELKALYRDEKLQLELRLNRYKKQKME